MILCTRRVSVHRLACGSGFSRDDFVQEARKRRPSLSCNLHDLNRRRRRGFDSLLSQCFEVQLDRFSDQLEGFLARPTGYATARQIRRIRAKTLRPFLDNHYILHIDILLQASLPEYVRQRARWHLGARVTCHCDGAWLFRMLQLTMASFDSHHNPTLLFQPPEHVAHFHTAMLEHANLRVCRKKSPISVGKPL